jgi:hypothetical protein
MSCFENYFGVFVTFGEDDGKLLKRHKLQCPPPELDVCDVVSVVLHADFIKYRSGLKSERAHRNAHDSFAMFVRTQGSKVRVADNSEIH